MPIVGEILVRMEGVFDLRAAERIAEALSRIGPGGTVRIDLSQIREFHDAGVAALARTLAVSSRRVHVILRGLRQHQVRILGYLGVDVEALEAWPAGAGA